MLRYPPARHRAVVGGKHRLARAERQLHVFIPVEVQTLKREGYGATSKGGDGGRVVWVTNLKDAGPGSLRKALAIEEPRTVKFKVGGVIELARPLVVKSGRVTIDGLSAAASGGITVQGGFHIRGCEDVIVRHIRSRGGYDTLLILHRPLEDTARDECGRRSDCINLESVDLS